MPAPKDQPNLLLQHHVPPHGRGVVIPASAVPDPDWLVGVGAAAWTGDPVTVTTAPPGAGAGAVTPLTTAGDAEEVAEAAVRIQRLVAERERLAKDNERLAGEVKDLAEQVRAKKAKKEAEESADLAAARQHAEQVAHAKMHLEGENERLNKELAEVRAGLQGQADLAEQVKKLEKELAEAKKKHK